MLDIIEKFRRNPKDTGSSEVQIALMTERIRTISDHLKTHPKDFHSQRGLMKSINQRRSLLAYLKRAHVDRYQHVVSQLGLRH